MSKKPKLGSGKRFKKLVQALMKKGYSREQAVRIAAYIGWKKYGHKMALLAAKARKKKK